MDPTFLPNQSQGALGSESPSVVRQFAEAHRLKWRLDECGDAVIPGKHGEIGGHGDGRLNACFHGVGAQPFSRLRAHRIKQAIQRSIDRLVQENPSDVLLNGVDVPVALAASQLQAGLADTAVRTLDQVKPYEFPFVVQIGNLCVCEASQIADRP